MITRKKLFAFLLMIFFDVNHGISTLMRGGIHFQDCGSELEITTLDISSCDRLPCKVDLGDAITVTFEMDIQGKDSYRNMGSMSFEAYWQMGGRQLNAMIIPETCNLGDCLSITDKRISFTVSLYVSDILAGFRHGTLVWRNKNYKTKEPLTCSSIPIVVE